MAAKEVVFGDVARQKMVEGVNILANAEECCFCIKLFKCI